MTAWVEPFTATTNTVISSSDHNSGVRGNLIHLHDKLPDPSTSGQLLVSASTSTAVWTTKPNGDTVLGVATITGNSGTSAIGTNVILPSRLVDGGSTGQPLVSGGGAGLANFGVVTAAGIQAGAIGDTQLGLLAVSSSKLATPSVTTPAILDECVTEPKLDIDNTGTNGQVLSYASGTGRMTWATLGTPGAYVPSGLHGFFNSDAALAAATGWAENTNGAGRMISARGTVFGQTWAVANPYGSAWEHKHTISDHSHGMSTVATIASTDAVNNILNGGGAGTSVRPVNHTHGITGVTDGSGAGDTSNPTYYLPHYALILANKT